MSYEFTACGARFPFRTGLSIHHEMAKLFADGVVCLFQCRLGYILPLQCQLFLLLILHVSV